VDRSGVPKNLGAPIVKLVRLAMKGGETSVLRHTLTLLFVLRNAPVPCASPDYSTITDGKPPVLPEELLTFSEKMVRRRKWNIQPKPFNTYLSTSMGPNGPAMLAAYEDLLSLSSQQLKSLEALTLPTDARRKYLRDDYRNWPSILPKGRREKLFTRKLVPIPDKEGKTRVIAIFDYWSQSSLKEVHESLNKILMSIPEDCTFNQGKILDAVNLPEGTIFHSVDLKSATDYFPVNFQTQVMS